MIYQVKREQNHVIVDRIITMPCQALG